MLAGNKVKLRGWKDEDIPGLLSLREDIATQTQLMAQPRPHSMERVERWLMSKSDTTNEFFIIIADTKNDTLIGYMQYTGMDMLHRFVDLGICVLPAHHGKGHGTEAMALAENYLKHIFGIRKVLLNVLKENSRAISFYKKNGFSICGEFHKHIFLDNAFRNVVIMEKFLIEEIKL